MSDHHDDLDDLSGLDERARAAAQGLRAHVLERVEAERSLHDLGDARPPARGRVLAVAAVVLLITGTVAVVGQRGDDGRARVELDEPIDMEPGVLTPLGPRDGKDSVQLPITVEPNRGLADGDTVTVSGSGFEPGEQVGIVQCAREAGGETAEVRGGIDGCYIGDVQYADADDAGTATGTYTVRRVVTTALTGTVDCAAEADRCIVAMGALNDYDRSGGLGIAFVGGGEPIHIPSVSVTPSEGLSHGDVVELDGRGFDPGGTVDITVCSTDPSSCWQAGSPEGGSNGYIGLTVDDEGAVKGEVMVWRFLPGAEPGSYVDCAVSECSLRVNAGVAPPPTPLSFDPTGDPPEAPSIGVDRTEGLAPGDVVVVQGTGFDPDTRFYVSLCAGPPGDASARYACSSNDAGDRSVEDDGTFTIEFEVPDVGGYGEVGGAPSTTMCAPNGGCEATVAPQGDDIRCDGVTTECAIVVDTYLSAPSTGGPVWAPAPVVVTFR